VIEKAVERSEQIEKTLWRKFPYALQLIDDATGFEDLELLRLNTKEETKNFKKTQCWGNFKHK
jgi:heme-degrading monooxygenase HmoA